MLIYVNTGEHKGLYPFEGTFGVYVRDGRLQFVNKIFRTDVEPDSEVDPEVRLADIAEAAENNVAVYHTGNEVSYWKKKPTRSSHSTKSKPKPNPEPKQEAAE